MTLTSSITIDDIYAYPGDTITLTALLNDQNGNPIIGVPLLFEVNYEGIDVLSQCPEFIPDCVDLGCITDSYGVTSIDYLVANSFLVDSVIPFTVTFQGDSAYSSTSISGNIVIIPTPVSPNEPVYNIWTFTDKDGNVYIPRWIVSVDDSQFPKITLHCASSNDLIIYDERFPNPRDEIEMWNKLSCNNINETILSGGGTDVQGSLDGQILTISEGSNTWRGAIYPISSTPDDTADNFIEYDIIIQVAINTENSTIYQPDLRNYANIAYNAYNGGTVTGIVDLELGSKIGSMTIIEQDLVKQINVTGYAANIPSSGAWLNINGVVMYWDCSHDHLPGDVGDEGIQTLEFILVTPSNILNFSTSPSYPLLASGNVALNNSGTIINQIEVIKEVQS
jgi:hypothetical protein